MQCSHNAWIENVKTQKNKHSQGMHFIPIHTPPFADQKIKAQETNFKSMATQCPALIFSNKNERHFNWLYILPLCCLPLHKCCCCTLLITHLPLGSKYWYEMLPDYCKHVWYKVRMFVITSNQWYNNNPGFIEGQIVCRIALTADALIKEPYGTYSYTRLCTYFIF